MKYHKKGDLGIYRFRDDKLEITVKEVISLGEIRFGHKFRGKVGISLGKHLKETVRGILLT